MKKTLNIKGQLLDLSRPKVMGILNLTPDSFYEGSRFLEKKKLLQKEIEKMISDGVDIIDVGGYSTRPNAEDISILQEIKRIVPAVELIKEINPTIPISIDTFRSEVAQEAVMAGASLINDVSGGDLDSKMLEKVVELGVPYVMMHMRGTPKTMQQQTQYTNIVVNVVAELQQKIAYFEKNGVKDIVVDVGFGFAKTIEQNYELLQKLETFRILEKPILAGLSRKSMIWKVLETTPSNALNGTTALNMIALKNGASILRVHDVREAKEAIQLHEQLELVSFLTVK
jgi:dihydropteroate synthase